MKSIFFISLIACFLIFTSIVSINGSKSSTLESRSLETYQEDSIIYDTMIFPVDSLLKVKVFRPGIFHHNEVWEDATKFQWLGIFKFNEGYFIKHTPVFMSQVYDQILDKEGQKSGWEVKTPTNDYCFLLIENLPILKQHKIETIHLKKDMLFPGDTLDFSFQGIRYQLYALGKTRKEAYETEWITVWNYKLYLTAFINGEKYQNLLVAQPNFNNEMIDIIFAGDIDNDKRLDLIINTSYHYNMYRPTLYLSKPATKSEILKPVGRHISVGC